MNRLYALASVGFCVASAALTTTSASALPTEEIPKAEPAYIAKVKTAAPASVVNNATHHHAAAGWIFQDGPNRIERFHRALSEMTERPNAMTRTPWNGARL